MGFKTNIPDVQRRMRERAQRMRDLTPVLRPAAAELDRMMDDSFDKQESPMGEAWAPLKQSTIAKRSAQLRRKVRGKKKAAAAIANMRILHDSGRYRRAHNARAGKRKITFGTNTKYSHQLPATNRDGTIRPARKTMPVEKRGGRWVFSQRGQAGKFRARVMASVKRYIVTGRVV